MTKIAYETKRFNRSSLAVIHQADAIVTEYRQQGFVLTLRQLYYQFVARGYLPNKQTEYKRLGQIVNDARMCGLLDWEDIEDRTRNLVAWRHFTSPESAIQSALDTYALDKWIGQKHRVEVWIEKDALTGVIEPICSELDISYFACRGKARSPSNGERGSASPATTDAG